VKASTPFLGIKNSFSTLMREHQQEDTENKRLVKVLPVTMNLS
jgi:hypothetical protein